MRPPLHDLHRAGSSLNLVRIFALVFFSVLSFSVRADLALYICGDSTHVCNLPEGNSPPPIGTPVDTLGFSSDGGSTVVNVDPSVSYPTPSGWTGPASPGGQPTPPGSVASVEGGICNLQYGASSYSGVMAACQAMWNDQIAPRPDVAYFSGLAAVGSLPNSCQPNVSITSGYCSYLYGSTTNSYFFNSSSNSYVQTICPTGYLLVSGVCNLDNPSLVLKPADGSCGMVSSSGVLAVDGSDPDCSTIPLASRGLTALSAAQLKSTRPDGTNTTITSNPDGSLTVTSSKNLSNGNTQYDTFVISGGAGTAQGSVTGSSSSVGQGQGSLAGAGGTGSAPSAPAAPVNFPTDLNKEVTQQGILAELKIDGAINTLPTTASVLGEMTSSLNQVNGLATDASSAGASSSIQSWGWWTWTPDFGAGSCVPFSKVIYGKTISLDLCVWVANIRDAIGWLFAMFAVWNIYGLIFRRVEA